MTQENETKGADVSRSIDGLVMPSHRKGTLLEVVVTNSINPWITGINGGACGMWIEDWEKLLEEDEAEVLAKGDGSYLLYAYYEEDQIGEYGATEIELGWQFALERFEPA